MKDQEILKKAVNKAVKNGWDDNDWLVGFETCIKENTNFEILMMATIFNHSFAKAFWGEDRVGQFWCGKRDCGNGGEHYHEKHMSWKRELMEMVLEEEPLQYLKKFL